MSDWKILIADSLDDSGKEILRTQAEVIDQPGISPDDLLAGIGEIHGLVVRGRTKVTKEVIEAGNKLKVVGRAGVGVDNIDLAAAQSKGVIVINTPTATTNAVAEHTLAMILALLRHVHQADGSMKAGLWHKKQLGGEELDGKTLGIIGLGRIGCKVSQLAQAFGAYVIGYDPLRRPAYFKQFCVESVELSQLFDSADIISIHVPLSPETRGMINDEALSSMRRGVYIVNTARGEVINDTALLARLESGQVAGAALDVYAEEPPGLTALVAHPNVIATPHIAAQTVEAQQRAAEQLAGELLNALNDEPLQWRVV
jgi:D-3-phosphoglycerate dehydrogenase